MRTDIWYCNPLFSQSTKPSSVQNIFKIFRRRLPFYLKEWGKKKKLKERKRRALRKRHIVVFCLFGWFLWHDQNSLSISGPSVHFQWTLTHKWGCSKSCRIKKIINKKKIFVSTILWISSYVSKMTLDAWPCPRVKPVGALTTSAVINNKKYQ